MTEAKPILDSHVHITAAAGIDPLMELSLACGLGRINIVCSAGSPDRSLDCNAIAMLAKARHPGKVYVFGGLHYGAGEPTTAEGLLRQARELREAGCDGMKMLEGKPSSRKRIPYRMDDPVYDLYYEFLQAEAIPIIWHVADPATFWDPAQISESARRNGWDYTDGSVPPREQFYEEIEGVLARFPRLRVTFAHFYFLSREPERAASFLRRWPSVGFDLTPGAEMYRNFSRDPARWRAFFTTFRDRLIFGTDDMAPREPWPAARAGMLDKVGMMRRFLETGDTFEGFCTATSRLVTGLGLDGPTLDLIYARNFERFAGATPRPMNRELARHHCRRVLEFARRSPSHASLRAEVEAIDGELAGS